MRFYHGAGNNFQGGRFWYKKNINDDGNAAIACPASIDIYYLKDKKEYLINNKSEYKIYTYTPATPLAADNTQYCVYFS